VDIDIHSIASLARLELSDEEKRRLGSQLGAILEYVKQLDELDTEDIEPTSHVVSLSTPCRADEVGDHLATEAALLNAPERDDDSFIVPQVL
jgi:aspartyl-tRNA(Asn)/glutamyl-tRNA(Gln) amidotransferase subunit C